MSLRRARSTLNAPICEAFCLAAHHYVHFGLPYPAKMIPACRTLLSAHIAIKRLAFLASPRYAVFA